VRRGIHRSWRIPRGRGPAGERGIEQRDRELLALLDDRFALAARRAGPRLACRPGCDDCCFGPFPITSLDVRRLRRGIDQLEARDPERAEAVRRRGRGAAAALAQGYPGDPVNGRLDADAPTLDRFFARHAKLPCPALDPSSGRCDLYEHRPVSCRTYGPPSRFADRSTPPCRLCFVDASHDEIEACRYEPDPEGIETAILGAMEEGSGREWETLIAFALAEAEIDHRRPVGTARRR
jgi:Fe-S-cluster containining protein